MEKFTLNNGEGCVFLSLNVQNTLKADLKVSDNLWVLKDLPFPIVGFWREQRGEIIAKEIEDSKIYLISKYKLMDIVDYEAVKKDLFYFYMCLFLIGFIQLKKIPYWVSFKNTGSGIEVENIQEQETISSIECAPNQDLQSNDFLESFKFLKQLQKLEQDNDLLYKRYFRSFSIFFSAAFNQRQDNLIIERLPQFVRAIEGFILPPIGDTQRKFVYRTKLFLGEKFQQDMDDLYTLRSNMIHMHEYENQLDNEIKKVGYVFFVNCKVLEAEAIARYCLKTFLMNEKLWVHFEDDNKIKGFWDQSGDNRQVKQKEKSRRTLWGDPMDFKVTKKEIKRSVNDFLNN